MDKYYKLFIGDYDPKGGMCAAPKMYLPSVNWHGLTKQVQDALKQLKYGLDLYIKKPNGEVFAWHRDLSKYTKEDIREILR